MPAELGWVRTAYIVNSDRQKPWRAMKSWGYEIFNLNQEIVWQKMSERKSTPPRLFHKGLSNLVDQKFLCLRWGNSFSVMYFTFSVIWNYWVGVKLSMFCKKTTNKFWTETSVNFGYQIGNSLKQLSGILSRTLSEIVAWIYMYRNIGKQSAIVF